MGISIYHILRGFIYVSTSKSLLVTHKESWWKACYTISDHRISWLYCVRRYINTHVYCIYCKQQTMSSSHLLLTIDTPEWLRKNAEIFDTFLFWVVNSAGTHDSYFVHQCCYERKFIWCPKDFSTWRAGMILCMPIDFRLHDKRLTVKDDWLKKDRRLA